MILRYWDPGIREEARLTGRLESEVRIGDGIFQDWKVEDGSSRFSLDLGWGGLIEGTTKTEIWIRRQLRIMRIWILIFISILIKTKSNQDEDMQRKDFYEGFEEEINQVIVKNGLFNSG
ncbi:hypothetical protein HID58_067710 [Brassica napus]|uniref:Uncharacterized protein n=1 Tax=Brassica napus TaxID=3708 RepID=A0ABQ7ZJF6_BRANA|nr:hypothetical protein HID58_067710 [Brassica napus]